MTHPAPVLVQMFSRNLKWIIAAHRSNWRDAVYWKTKGYEEQTAIAAAWSLFRYYTEDYEEGVGGFRPNCAICQRSVASATGIGAGNHIYVSGKSTSINTAVQTAWYKLLYGHYQRHRDLADNETLTHLHELELEAYLSGAIL